MEHNKAFQIDCPVVQVTYVSFKHEFERANHGDLVFVFTVETFE